MNEAMRRLVALGAMLALCDMLLGEETQKQGARLIGALLTAGVLLELLGGAARFLGRL